MSHEKGACSGLSGRINGEVNLISTSQLKHATKQERTGQGKGRRSMRKRRKNNVAWHFLRIYVILVHSYTYMP
jgi:hypothetical protein